MSCKAVENFFLNFSNRTKLDIIIALKDKSLNVTEISEKLNQEQSKISHNLSKLTKCNIITVKQKGKQRIYSLNKETVLPMLRLVQEHVKSYCQGGCYK